MLIQRMGKSPDKLSTVLTDYLPDAGLCSMEGRK